MDNWFVEIRPFVGDETDPGFKRIDCGPSYHSAERVESGANINLNHDKYYTIIVCDDKPSLVESLNARKDSE